jgi:ResB-like family
MTFRKIIHRLASLKFAVVVILAIATLVAWGTIVEAQYMDAKMAQETVYHSWLSYLIFGLFSINLTAVIIDRYPWKKHHVGFICAHIGILILLGGSLVTRYWGVDGSMTIDMGGKSKLITVSETDLVLYTSFGMDSFQKFHEQKVNFFANPPSAKNPLKIPLASGDVIFDDFYHYALMDSKIVPSEDKEDPAGLRFQISNDRVNQTQWLLGKKNQPSEIALGPATIVLTSLPYVYNGGNVLVLKPLGDEKVYYEVYSDRLRQKIKEGEVKAGAQFDLGWMNLQFRLLKYIPQAKQDIKYVKREQSSPEAVSAVRFTYNGKTQWLGLNSMVRLFGDSEMYVLTYGNRQLPLSFEMLLKNFEVGRYQGTMRAASYQSLVFLSDERREVLISMNEPLQHKGYTFYQASFQEDPMGKPIATVLSVNYDPGRWFKYLGSLFIVFGAVHLFYRRWQKVRGAHA